MNNRLLIVLGIVAGIVSGMVIGIFSYNFIQKKPSSNNKPANVGIISGTIDLNGEVTADSYITVLAREGDKISFDKVLLVDDGKDTTIGTPYITGAKVGAEIAEIGRARKVLIMKYKQKSRYLRRGGHRQPFFKVKITSIK